MGNVTNTTLSLIIIFLSIGLVIYIFQPFFLLTLVINPLLFIMNFINKLYTKFLFKKDNHYLLDLKIVIKYNVYLSILVEYVYKLYLFLFIRYEDIIGKENITRELEEGKQMALKAISAGREYFYICEVERTFKDPVTGEKKIMPLEEALLIAADKGYTVFKVVSRSARRAAEERDRMTEISTRGKKMVYELRSGSTDFHLMLSSISGWERLAAPDGVCERCGIIHQGEYLDFDALVNSKANQDKTKAGAFKNEIAVDHIPDFARGEIVRFVRGIDNGGVDLGEESSQSIDG